MSLRKTLAGLILTGTASLASVGKAKAGPIWHLRENHLYSLTPTTLNWKESEQYARAQGGHLVTINDSAEETWIKDTFGRDVFWIGFHQPNPLPKLEPTGGWEWSSGEPATFTNWYSGEPNNSNGIEHVGVMNIYNGRGWADYRYSYDFLHGIVEVPVPEPATIGLMLSGAAVLLPNRRKKQ